MIWKRNKILISCLSSFSNTLVFDKWFCKLKYSWSLTDTHSWYIFFLPQNSVHYSKLNLPWLYVSLFSPPPSTDEIFLNISPRQHTQSEWIRVLIPTVILWWNTYWNTSPTESEQRRAIDSNKSGFQPLTGFPPCWFKC